MSNETQTCTYILAWIGPCGKLGKDGRCKEHASTKCIACKCPATHQCPETLSLVCGAPLCDDCTHTFGSWPNRHGHGQKAKADTE